jgi:hypothetical protein
VVQILLESCYSGSMVATLKELDSDEKPNQIGETYYPTFIAHTALGDSACATVPVSVT